MEFPKAKTLLTIEEVDAKLKECVEFYQSNKPVVYGVVYLNELLDRRNKLGEKNTLTKPEEVVKSPHGLN